MSTLNFLCSTLCSPTVQKLQHIRIKFKEFIFINLRDTKTITSNDCKIRRSITQVSILLQFFKIINDFKVPHYAHTKDRFCLTKILKYPFRYILSNASNHQFAMLDQTLSAQRHSEWYIHTKNILMDKSTDLGRVIDTLTVIKECQLAYPGL